MIKQFLFIVVLLIVLSISAFSVNIASSSPPYRFMHLLADHNILSDLHKSESSGTVQVKSILGSSSTINAVNNSNWPQIQNNPQRTGYSPEILGTNFSVVWTRPFQPEKVHPQVQAIVYDGKVFVGTEMGNLYALDAQSGAQVWKYNVDTPILNSVAAGDGRIYFGAMDGAVYALNANSGGLIWKSTLSWRHGFSTAPVFAEGKVILGGRDGIMYALNPVDGQMAWQYDAGAPILQTAAWVNGYLIFGAMDMHVYAINSADGTLAWKSEKVAGMAFKDYWPVIYRGIVYIRPMGIGGLGVSDRSKVVDPVAQQAVLDDYDANPNNYTLSLFRFDVATGVQEPPIIHYDYQTMNGATSPPCVDRDGYLVIPALFTSGFITGWGRVDPATRIVVDILYDGTEAGYGNRDENMNLTCSGNLIFAIHTQEYNAHYTGVFDLDVRQWTRISPGHTNQQMSTNTQGGGGNPVSISNGFVYHISFHELIARSTE